MIKAPKSPAIGHSDTVNRSRHAARLPDEIDLRVARRLKERRRGLGLTQQELATTLGITFQQLQKYENGSNRLSAGRLYQIAKALGVGLNFFFADFQGNTSSNTETKPDFEGETSERILLDAFSTFSNLDSNARTLVLEVISLLAVRNKA